MEEYYGPSSIVDAEEFIQFQPFLKPEFLSVYFPFVMLVFIYVFRMDVDRNSIAAPANGMLKLCSFQLLNGNLIKLDQL
jgi:hypothetical protein